MMNDENEQDDALPDELVRALRDTSMPSATVERAVVDALREGGVLSGRARPRRVLPWLLASAAVVAAFVVGMHVGERRGAREARLVAIPPALAGSALAASANTVDRHDIVLWF